MEPPFGAVPFLYKNNDKNMRSYGLTQRDERQRTRKESAGGEDTKAAYSLENARPNPYIDKLRKPVTMNLDTYAIDYFKREVDRTGVPYQRLINLNLVQYAREGKKLAFV